MSKEKLVGLAVVGLIGAAYLAGRYEGEHTPLVQQSSPAPIVQPAVANRVDLIKEAMARDHQINRGMFGSYRLDLGGKSIRAIKLPNDAGIEFYDEDSALDNNRKLSVELRVDSSVRVQTGRYNFSADAVMRDDFSGDVVIRNRAVAFGDKALAALLEAQKKTLYGDNPSYKRLENFLTTQ